MENINISDNHENINENTNINIVKCTECIHHFNCEIEVILNRFCTDNKFCSAGKRNHKEKIKLK